MKLNLKFT